MIIMPVYGDNCSEYVRCPTLTTALESFIDRHVAGAWPRARFGHKFTKALRHEVAVGTLVIRISHDVCIGYHYEFHAK